MCAELVTAAPKCPKKKKISYNRFNREKKDRVFTLFKCIKNDSADTKVLLVSDKSFLILICSASNFYEFHIIESWEYKQLQEGGGIGEKKNGDVRMSFIHHNMNGSYT